MKFKKSGKIKGVMKDIKSVSGYKHNRMSTFCSKSCGAHILWTFNGAPFLAETISKSGRVLVTTYPLGLTIYHKTKKIYLHYC